MTNPKELTRPEKASIYELIASEPRPVKMVEFPIPYQGKTYELAMRPLIHTEMKAMLLATGKKVKEHCENNKLDLGSPEVETIRRNRSVVETLFRACRDPNNPDISAFPSPDVLERFSDDVLDSLFKSYQRVDYQLGQRIGEMSESLIQDWIDALIEGGEATAENFFDRASSVALLQLVNALTSRLVKQNSDTSSSGSPVSESEIEQ